MSHVTSVYKLMVACTSINTFSVRKQQQVLMYSSFLNLILSSSSVGAGGIGMPASRGTPIQKLTWKMKYQGLGIPYSPGVNTHISTAHIQLREFFGIFKTGSK